MDTLVIAAIAAFAFVLAVLLYRDCVLNLYYKDAGFYLRGAACPSQKAKRETVDSKSSCYG